MRAEKRPSTETSLWEVQPGWRLACPAWVPRDGGSTELVGGLFGLESFQDHFSAGPSRKVSGMSFPRLRQIDSLSLIRFANRFLQPLKSNSMRTREWPC